MFVHSFLLVALLTAAAPPSGDQMRKMYYEGVQLFGGKKYIAAKKAFEELLPALQSVQQKRKQGTRGWHLMTLGQCDVMYHLAQIAEAQSEPRKACRIYQKLINQFKTVPGAWKTWNVYPNLPTHLSTANQRWTTFCPTVPSEVQLDYTPPNAKVERLIGKDKWVPLSMKKLPVKERTITIRVTAPGYKTQILTNVPVPLFQVKKLSIKLDKKKVVAVARPRPTLPPPPKKQGISPLVWVGVGVVAAAAIGGGVAAIVYFASPAKHELFTPGESCPDGKCPPKIW